MFYGVVSELLLLVLPLLMSLLLMLVSVSLLVISAHLARRLAGYQHGWCHRSNGIYLD